MTAELFWVNMLAARMRSTNTGAIVMSWNKPKVKEVCIGMEINDYFAAEL